MAEQRTGVDILQGRRVILGVTGGIAAPKACSLVTSLRKRGAEVRVVMTEHATSFITPTTLATLSGNQVGYRMFAENLADELQHIHLQQFGEALLVAPATANILGKTAHGIADDLLSTTIMAATCPVIFAPAMNHYMWRNPLVQENVQKLQRLGYRFVMPEEGRLASGAVGVGRLAGEEVIIAAVEEALAGAVPAVNLSGWQIVVSAGPTREYLDPVRFLTNRSTGRMGFALAVVAAEAGAQVTVVAGPTEVPPPPGVKIVAVTSCAEMKAAVMAACRGADLYVSAAAPADYRPAAVSDTKIKKGESLSLTLERTEDILQAVTETNRPALVVGFAAETGEAVAKARGKLTAKHLDLLVVNDVSRPDSGFAVDTNEVVILRRDGSQRALPLMSKRAVAATIMAEVVALRAATK